MTKFYVFSAGLCFTVLPLDWVLPSLLVWVMPFPTCVRLVFSLFWVLGIAGLGVLNLSLNLGLVVVRLDVGFYFLTFALTREL